MRTALPWAIDQLGLQDRRVGDIGLPRRDQAFEFDGEEPRRGRIVAAEQGVEHRIAIRARQAAPDDAPMRVDQRIERTVADHAEREIAPPRAQFMPRRRGWALRRCRRVLAAPTDGASSSRD